MLIYLEKVVKHGTTKKIFKNPTRSYINVLIIKVIPNSNIKVINSIIVLEEEVSNALNIPSGYCFHICCPRNFSKRRVSIIKLNEEHGVVYFLLLENEKGESL